MPERKKTSKKTVCEKKDLYFAGNYLSDCVKEGMLYAVILRSPAACGKIKSIKIDLPENYYFFCADDIPGENKIYTLDFDSRVFCNEEVDYLGQPVGIIAGADIDVLKKIASKADICFEYTSFSADNSLQDKIKSNIVYERIVKTGIFKNGNKSSNEDAASLDTLETTDNIMPEKQIIDNFFKEFHFDVSGLWQQKENTPSWLENSGAFCFMEGSAINIFSTTKWPGHLSKAVSKVLNIDESKVIIRKTLSQSTDMSGLWRNSFVAVQTAVASFLTGRPVKLILSNEEQVFFMQAGLKTSLFYRSGTDDEGCIKAMYVDINADAGYGNPFAKEIGDRLAAVSCSFYNIENLLIHVKIHSSKTPPTSIYPNLIASQVFFALENHIQQIADKTNIFPDEIRIKNITSNEDELKSPFKFKIAKVHEVFSEVIKQSDFYRKYTSFRLNAQYDRQNRNTFFSLGRRGIGFSCAYSGSYFCGSYFNSYSQKMEVTLGTDGFLTINTAIIPPLIAEIWKKDACEILQLSSDHVLVVSDYKNSSNAQIPENFYNIGIMTVLLKRCCGEIQKKRFHSPLPISSKKTITSAMKKQWDNISFSGTPFYYPSFGAAVVELEINSITYKEKINSIRLCLDCGEIVSLKEAEKIARLAIQQDMERLTEDEAVFCRQVHISFITSNKPPCRIAEIVHNLIPAAFTAALSQALGASVNYMPCSEELFYSLTVASSLKEIENKQIKNDGIQELKEIIKDELIK